MCWHCPYFMRPSVPNHTLLSLLEKGWTQSQIQHMKWKHRISDSLPIQGQEICLEIASNKSPLVQAVAFGRQALKTELQRNCSKTFLGLVKESIINLLLMRCCLDLLKPNVLCMPFRGPPTTYFIQADSSSLNLWSQTKLTNVSIENSLPKIKASCYSLVFSCQCKIYVEM